MTCWYHLGLIVMLCVAKFILSNNNKPKWADERDTAMVITEILTGWIHLAEAHFLIVLSVKHFRNVLLNKICVHTINLLRSFAVRISLLFFVFQGNGNTFNFLHLCGRWYNSRFVLPKTKERNFCFFPSVYDVSKSTDGIMKSLWDCYFLLSHILKQFYSSWVF